MKFPLIHRNQDLLRSTFKKKRVFLLIFGLFTALLSINAFFKPLVNFDNIWLDFAVKKWSVTSPADPNIVVIDIDDPSLQAMTSLVGRWPWPRSVHAELIEQILLQTPQAVVFDILFSEPDIYRPDADQYLSEVIESSNNVFLPILHFQSAQAHLFPKLSEYPDTVGLSPPSELNGQNQQTRANLLLPNAIVPSAWKVGTINFSSDHDGVGRRYQVEHQIGEWRVDSLPTKVARYLGAVIPEQDHIILDWRTSDIQTNMDGRLVPYSTFSYAAVYKAISEETPFIEPGFFTDKIVLIGATATGLHDIKNTPISTQFPGVYILATAIDNLLHDQKLTALSDSTEWIIGFFSLCLITLGLLFSKRIVPVALAFGVLMVSYFLASYFLVSAKYLMVVNSPLTILSTYFISILIMQYLQRQQEYNYAIDIFGRFMDPNVVHQLVDSGQTEQTLHAKSCKVTVLFSDIRNFTTLSERHTPLEIVKLLDDYFSLQVNVIFTHHGTLDKFIGDAIMAFWGAPLENDNQEIEAVEAALAMVDKLEEFRHQQNLPEFNIGIGIHTGEAVVGAIGGEQRYDYTVIGDTVNVASRVEGITKNRCHILVSASTRDACSDHFDFTEQGSYTLKGREKPVVLFTPSRKQPS
ncbi:adenylate/guanylate cyclase domain-containing protein [Vibrio sp. Of7-15]|uniref:CHASE2 domain-containing protein n=1 Tax=Vibrio sp. Of7-15 TaxID=2724879 RepID=UPI001EF18067|nr:adenylate/guanylate cyclase domain-containing protein [Vibrio sp. Of7-15]MCG7498098.1 adenylate/guanylate cyclase domain-containing protein [Vibrio sp. Of7-15]